MVELMATYRHWNKQLREIFEATERCYKWALHDRDPLTSWGRDRVTLLGDSAHAMLPYLAQGAGQSIEDACILAALLERFSEDPKAALERYQALRLPRTRQIQLGARERGRLNHLSSPWARLWRDAGITLRRWGGGGRALQDIAWIYGYDARARPATFWRPPRIARTNPGCRSSSMASMANMASMSRSTAMPFIVAMASMANMASMSRSTADAIHRHDGIFGKTWHLW
jgi:hypothetical protein